MIYKESDLNKIKKACKITSKIFKELVKHLKEKKFCTEKDVEKFLKRKSFEHGCKVAFEPVVANNKNGFELHHKASDKKLSKGFLVVDFGVKYKGFCSDCTRTFYLGKPSKEEGKMYDLVLEALENVIFNLSGGMYAADVDMIARVTMIDFFKNFIHCAGHGVGRRVHQAPKICPRSKDIIKKGEVVAIEPGLYLKNRYGIRIEDTILIKEKPIILTKSDKKMVIVDGY